MRSTTTTLPDGTFIKDYGKKSSVMAVYSKDLKFIGNIDSALVHFFDEIFERELAVIENCYIKTGLLKWDNKKGWVNK